MPSLLRELEQRQFTVPAACADQVSATLSAGTGTHAPAPLGGPAVAPAERRR
ncbi:hypothetical protein [Streptomyces sp. NPDC002685]|uniref:hypothetical protein n=1 Tax=Streptomyces sp. NPDC002685 TaxID=3154540 RepID=UPI00332FD095